MSLDIGPLQSGNLDIGPLQGTGTGGGLVGVSGLGITFTFDSGFVGALQLVGSTGLEIDVLFGHGAINAQTITGSTGLAITATFDSGSLGFYLLGHYPLQINVEFDSGALIKKPITVFVDGVDRTDLVLVNSINIQLALSQSSTATFGLWDPNGDPSVIPQVGQEVLIYRNGIRIFGGSVEQPVQSAYQALPGHLFSGSGGGSGGGVGSATGSGGSGSGGVQCTDFSNLLDRRYVGQSFQLTINSLREIVSQIVAIYFNQDGITYDSSDGDPGINLGPQLFNWVTGRQAFNTLSSLTGWDFSVDAYKVLRFFPKASALGGAPFSIHDNDRHVYAESLSLEYYRSKYRNRQGIRYPSNALWSDTYSAAHPGPFPNEPQPPDGIRQGFLTLYNFIGIPQVTVDGNAQVVINIDDPATPITTPGAQWYVLETSGTGSGVFQIPSHTPLNSGQVLVISYQTDLAPIYWVQNDAQILARAAIEGNSGIYEDVQDAPNTITDPLAIQVYAQSLLDRYGSAGMPFQIGYSTDDFELVPTLASVATITPGQLQEIILSNPAISLLAGLINSVQITDVDGQYFMYNVVVLSGEYQGDWTQFFAALVTQAQIPQASNFNTYYWQVAPTIPGVTNPGVTGGYITPQVNVVKNAVELVRYMIVHLAQTNVEIVHFTLNVNSDGRLGIDIRPGTDGNFTAYPDQPIRLYAGDVMVIELDGGGINPVKDATVTVVTTIAVT